jgi:hypothetical protein
MCLTRVSRIALAARRGARQCFAKPRARRPQQPRVRFTPNQQTKRPPDKAGWCFSLLVEPGGIEPPSASPLQADLHT